MSVHVTQQATVISEQGSLDLPRIGWQNLARDATVSASSEQEGFPADAPQRPETYEYWKPSSLLATWQADLSSAQSVNYVAIAAHTLGSKSCSVYVQSSDDAETWTNVSDVATPEDDSPIMLLFPAVSARYFRLVIDGVESPTTIEMPSIGVIYMGAVLAMPRPIYGGHTPATLSRTTVLHQALSQGGQFLGQGFRRVGFKTSVAFKHLTAAWYRANFDPFVEAARNYPFFFAWRASDFSDELIYAWCEEDIAPSNMGVQSFMQVSFPMTGYGNEQ